MKPDEQARAAARKSRRRGRAANRLGLEQIPQARGERRHPRPLAEAHLLGDLAERNRAYEKVFDASAISTRL
jgi:hypothetical protein